MPPACLLLFALFVNPSIARAEVVSDTGCPRGLASFEGRLAGVEFDEEGRAKPSLRLVGAGSEPAAPRQESFVLLPGATVSLSFDGELMEYTLLGLNRADWLAVRFRCDPEGVRVVSEATAHRKKDGSPAGPGPRLDRLREADAALLRAELARRGGVDLWAACGRVNLYGLCLGSSFGRQTGGTPYSIYNALGRPPIDERREGGLKERCLAAGADARWCEAVSSHLAEPERHGLKEWTCAGSVWSTDGTCRTPEMTCATPASRFDESKAAEAPTFKDEQPLRCVPGWGRYSACFCAP